MKSFELPIIQDKVRKPGACFKPKADHRCPEKQRRKNNG